ncbi:GNAT family N-acetyltransferase [Proteiniclasticum sp. SCR006]|uniref:GNAT family N-acetyltransferase n=1 Tax=Proteiniclasticum aestuarii TaxID=2817862 RepID=A0A939KIW5_9CLOT|nr:GNAT family N-acetyltransferase [Proteiniclasticum aestuarii]MBO1264568.1 GNAT family N-acetyltransferase [Proteiniclasticum aestuarii]
MNKTKVYMEEIKETDGKEFIIRDEARITIGRFTIVERNSANKSIMIRLRFYREGDRSLLRESLGAMTRGFLRDGSFFKVNVIVSDDISTVPFTELGYTLEGILVNNSYQDSRIRNEYLFGTDNTRFNQFKEFKLLALDGERVSLKLASPENVEDYLIYYTENREFLRALEPHRNAEFYTLTGQRKALDENYKQYMNGLAINFGVYYSGKLIGKVQLSNLVYGGFRSATLGYALHKDFEGKGLMNDALKAAISYAFEELMLHRIEASTLLDNYKSQNVLKRLGFKLVGINEKYLYINGKWQDHYTFSLISES